jgi:hypothetical protein
MARQDEVDARVRLSEALWNDPETRGLMEEAVAKKFPDHATNLLPRHAARAAAKELVEPALEEARKLNEDTRTRQATIEMREARERARREIMADPVLRIREDEIAAVEAIMENPDEPVGSHRRAAQIYRSEQAVASRTDGNYGYSKMEIPGVNSAGGDDFKWLAPGVGNPAALDQVTRRHAEEIIHDFARDRNAAMAKWGAA